MIRTVLCLSPLLLAACGTPSADKAADAPPGTDERIAAAPAAPAAPEAPAAPDADTSTIPVPIQGRWGLVAADCTSTRGDAKGLLVIDANSIKFYESLGKLGMMRERSDHRIIADFAFTGEGMEWNHVVTLDAQKGGQTLIRRENGEGAMPGPLEYSRCA